MQYNRAITELLSTSKVATCTPVNFEAGSRFFNRDTGLLCRGFQAAGVDCVVVMPGISKPDDAPDLIRCTPKELESAKWWKTHKFDLVVLYAWADPKYLSVAKAIRESGSRLIQGMDTSGLHSPYADLRIWLTATLSEIAIPQNTFQRIKRIARIFRDFIPYLYERKRLMMMRESDTLAVVSPPAKASIAAYAHSLGSDEIVKKLIVMPHPVSKDMTYSGETKNNHLLAVGRWGWEDEPQKDSMLTFQTINDFLREHLDWTAEIIGPEAESLENYYSKLDDSPNPRLRYCNFIAHSELKLKYATSRILLCASRFESFHIASAEALCCGCSIVVANHPLLASTTWFVSRQSGSLALSRKRNDLLQALKKEAAAWQQDQRSPTSISTSWSKDLNCESVARNLLIRLASSDDFSNFYR